MAREWEADLGARDQRLLLAERRRLARQELVLNRLEMARRLLVVLLLLLALIDLAR
jgi:hypothetical protein